MSQVIILSDSSPLGGEYGNMRYMGAYSIAGSLRKAGISCVVIDYFTRIENFFAYIDQFITQDTAVIGVSSTFLAPWVSMKVRRTNRSDGWNRYNSGELNFETGEELLLWTKTLKEILHKKSPHAKLVLGGVKSQSAIWRPQFYKNFDEICIGAADQSFVEYVNSILHSKQPNTIVFDDVSYIRNQIDITNKICPEAFWSKKDAVQKNESLPIEVARGCIFSCKFCHYDKKESFRKTTETLRAELIRNYENFGTTVYSLCDDCFNDHPKKVEAYCEVFKSLPFKMEWTSYVRVDVAVKFPHTIDLMIESGASGLFWGLESFHPEVARKAGKGTPPDQVKKFLIDFKNKYSGQCLVEGSFIVGLPGESRESILNTFEWIKQHNALDIAHFAPLSIVPYVPNLDKRQYDYADYSKNPEKYGFKNIRFAPLYWEHDFFNYEEAKKLAVEITNEWRDFKKPGILQTIFIYGHARTLGFTKDQTLKLFRSNVNMPNDYLEVSQRFNEFIKSYHSELLANNNINSTEFSTSLSAQL